MTIFDNTGRQLVSFDSRTTGCGVGAGIFICINMLHKTYGVA